MCVWWLAAGSSRARSFVYHIEPTYYIVTRCLFGLGFFCKTYSFNKVLYVRSLFYIRPQNAYVREHNFLV